MERSMEIKLVSARDLNNVNLLTKMDVYAVVNLLAAVKSDQKFKTPVDKQGGCNPTWNFSIKFKIDEAAARANRLTLVFKLRCSRNLGDRDIGEVHVLVKELLDSAGDGDGNADLMQHLSYQVRKPSGNPQGVLNFAFKFKDYFHSGSVKPNPVQSYNPVSAYPAPRSFAVAHGGAYPPAPSYSSYEPAQSQPMYGYHHQPPPPSTAAYGYPPPPTYGYPPQPPSYYPPPAQKKKSNMGLGLGVGMVGGMLGGLLIGDIVADGLDF